MNTYLAEVRPAPSSFEKILLSLWHAACVSSWHGACAVDNRGSSPADLYAGGFARPSFLVWKLKKRVHFGSQNRPEVHQARMIFSCFSGKMRHGR
jgi:hypothetical protein